ncbi:hypothetical protein VNI00_008844 [Paramarasmius palmivorus]|uniref:Glycoside hydrolase family 76 protein n=1 Tax=Paramarasmius palmivorus TaxID=297713 RepID=A0AAW0CRK3_9AGAR
MSSSLAPQLRGNIMSMMICLAVLWHVVNSADAPIAIPSSWRKPTINLTMEDRIDFAIEALDKAYIEPIPEGCEVDLHTLLIEFDIAVNQTRYKDKVFHYFANVPSSKVSHNALPNMSIKDPHMFARHPMERMLDPLYGYAAALAHVAYKPESQIFLNIAMEIWKSNNNRVLSSSGFPRAVFQNTSNAKIKLIIDTLDEHRNCTNAHEFGNALVVDVSGGLIHNPTLGDMVTSENARFFRLSGVLAEITGDNQYLNAAQQSAKLFLSRLYTNDSLFWWAVWVDTQNPCKTLIDERKEPWNMGLTSSIVASSDYPEWHEPSGQGVLMLKDKQWSGADFARGLATILARKKLFNPALSTYVEAYLAVQYNALLDLATFTGTNIYGNSWIGPPNMTYSAVDQLAAARVLIAGININSQLDTQRPPEAEVPPKIPPKIPPKSRPVGSSGTNHTGKIVGGVLGGLFLIALAVVGSLFIIRRLRRQRSLISQVSPRNPLIPIPYVQQSEKRRGKQHMDGSLPQAGPSAEVPPPAYTSSR